MAERDSASTRWMFSSPGIPKTWVTPSTSRQRTTSAATLRCAPVTDVTLGEAAAPTGPVRLGSLAELEGTTAATMSRVIDSLADRRLIERVADPLDGRASLVRLSPEGGALLHELRARNTEALRSALDQLSDGEQRVVRRAIPVLERLSDLMQTSDRGGPL